MGDTVFKKQEDIKPSEEHVAIEKHVDAPIAGDNIEVPYLDNKNFLDDYFGLGKEWHDVDAKFYPEVERIDGYIKEKISDGEIGNDQQAVRKFLAGMEKLNNLKGETRSVVKLEVLSNYIEFLMKNDKLKSNLKRYA